MRQYFIKTADVEQGPFSETTILELARAGRLAATDLIRSDKEDRWREARTIRGFRPASEASPAPSRPRPEVSRPIKHRKRLEVTGGLIAGVMISAAFGAVGLWLLFQTLRPGKPEVAPPEARLAKGSVGPAEPPTTAVPSPASGGQGADVVTDAGRRATSSVSDAQPPSPADADKARKQRYKEAKAAYEAGDLSSAGRILIELRQADPENNAVLALLGSVLWKQERWDDAAIVFLKLAEAAPDNGAPWLVIADCKKNQSDLEGAIAAYSKAAELLPENFESVAFLVAAFLKLEDKDSLLIVAPQLEARLKYVPEGPDQNRIRLVHLRGLAAIYQHVAHNLEEAERLHKAVLAIAPKEDESLVFVAARSLQRNDVPTAFRLLTAVSSPTANSLRLFAMVEDERGNTDAAARAARQSVAIEPDNVPTWQLLARVEEKRGDSAAAIAAMDRVIKLAPADFLNHRKKSDLLFESRRFREAISAAEAALERGADPAWAAERRGSAHLGLGNRQEALAAFRTAMAAGLAVRNSANAEYTMICAMMAGIRGADVLVEDKRWIELAAHYEAMEKLEPEKATHWRRLRATAHAMEAGECVRRNDNTGGIRQLRTSVQLDPSPQSVRMLVSLLYQEGIQLIQAHRPTEARSYATEIAKYDRVTADELMSFIVRMENAMRLPVRSR